MEQTVSYLLMVKKFIDLKQKALKLMQFDYARKNDKRFFCRQYEKDLILWICL